jgi:lipopolysaccharide export system protein LptA
LRNRIKYFLLIALTLFLKQNIFAQKPNITPPSVPTPNIISVSIPAGTNQVEILHTDSIVVLNDGNLQKYRLITKNRQVELRQKTSIMYCNTAIYNVLTNSVEAFGNVKIIQADTVTITGDNATYAGNSRVAKITGNVLLNDNTIKLNTERLDYDLNTHVGYYNNNGKIVEGKSTLTSKEGFYDTVTKLFMFYKNVKIVDDESKVLTDSLKYSTISKEAFLIAPTNIYTKTDTMLVKRGIYNTVTKVSNFFGRSTARTKDYVLTADSLNFDSPSEIGILKGNAEIISKKDSVVLNGNFGKYYGKQGYSSMTNNALMRMIQGKDTLFLSADTLLSLENKELKTRRLSAFNHVVIFRKDLQGRCDSLTYSISDSTIAFFKKPVLWANGSQSEADSINLRLIDNKVRIMNLSTKSFVITQDSAKNFNQVKGRRITTYLNNESKIERVNVVGNGESIYFATDEKNIVIGMNRVDCGRMNINFKNNAVKRIAFIGKPDASLTPPHELTAEKRQLDGFRWREKEKPTRETTILNRISSFDSNKEIVLAKSNAQVKPLENIPLTKKVIKKVKTKPKK